MPPTIPAPGLRPIPARQQIERDGRPLRPQRGRTCLNHRTTEPPNRSPMPQRSLLQSRGSTLGRMNPQPITPSTFTSAAAMKAVV